MKKLIICEKPSLAKTVANAVGTNTLINGYYENEDYVITYGFGHLFTLKDVDDYLGQKNKWDAVPLPFIPERFLFKLKDDDGVRAQYGIIKQLSARMDIDAFIHCGDADREGEVIVRHIIQNTRVQKPVYRLWLPDQTPDTIRKQLSQLQVDELYNNLYNEGLVRTYEDWLFGINYTRYLTVRVGHNTMYPVGRVLIPIVEYIYNRDKEIENFVPKKYFVAAQTIERGENKIEIELPEEFDNPSLPEAVAYLNTVNSRYILVDDVKVKEIEKRPKKLFSLTTLQQTLNTRYGYSFGKSLNTIQSLYEKGYLTYPRTNTEYLAENEKDKMKSIISMLANNVPVVFKDSKRIFDSSKIESHSAITITNVVPNFKDLSGDEANVYSTVLNRVIANFCIHPCIAQQTEIIFDVQGIKLSIKGEVIKQKGWMEFENSKNDKLLPQFIKGEMIPAHFEFKEKKTVPPKKITENSLASYLKNPFRTDEMTEDEEYKAILDGLEIGTEATRTGIIENAVKYGYIAVDKTSFSITTKGCKLIELLKELQIDMFAKKTVELSKQLKEVYKSNIKPSMVIASTVEELNKTIGRANKLTINQEYYSDVVDEKSILGKCPCCKKGQIRKGKKAYFCTEWKNGCSFSLGYEHPYFTAMNKKITERVMKDFLDKGKTKLKLISSKGNPYHVYIILNVNDSKITFLREYCNK